MGLMYAHPLTPPPTDSPLLAAFLRDFAIDARLPPVELLTAAASAFARLPFENLTKIIKVAEAGRLEEARRSPAEVLADHRALGAGGTCFALTAALLYLVRSLGFQAAPILADRRYGADTHSALLVWIDGKPRLLDPGYLIVRPMELPKSGEVVVPTPFNRLILKAEQDERIALTTVQGKETTYRLTFKARPVDAGEFLRAWDISFDAEMLRYPVLSRVVGDQQLYFQKQHLLLRGSDKATRVEIPPDAQIAEIAQRFQIAPALIAKALKVLEKK